MLLVIGIIGFPLLFETQPRPMPVDMPIEIPRRDGAPPLVAPAAPARPRRRGGRPVRDASPRQPLAEPTRRPTRAAPAPRPLLARQPAPRPRAVACAAPSACQAALPARRSGARTAAHRETRQPKPAAAVAAASPDAAASRQLRAPRPRSTRRPPHADGARAQAGRSAARRQPRRTPGATSCRSAPTPTRPAREARAKVEKLGLKTYTQVVETPAGKRIRVRVGPYAIRDEADKAPAKAQGGRPARPSSWPL